MVTFIGRLLRQQLVTVWLCLLVFHISSGASFDDASTMPPFLNKFPFTSVVVLTRWRREINEIEHRLRSADDIDTNLNQISSRAVNKDFVEAERIPTSPDFELIKLIRQLENKVIRLEVTLRRDLQRMRHEDSLAVGKMAVVRDKLDLMELSNHIGSDFVGNKAEIQNRLRREATPSLLGSSMPVDCELLTSSTPKKCFDEVWRLQSNLGNRVMENRLTPNSEGWFPSSSLNKRKRDLIAKTQPDFSTITVQSKQRNESFGKKQNRDETIDKSNEKLEKPTKKSKKSNANANYGKPDRKPHHSEINYVISDLDFVIMKLESIQYLSRELKSVKTRPRMTSSMKSFTSDLKEVKRHLKNIARRVDKIPAGKKRHKSKGKVERRLKLLLLFLESFNKRLKRANETISIFSDPKSQRNLINLVKATKKLGREVLRHRIAVTQDVSKSTSKASESKAGKNLTAAALSRGSGVTDGELMMRSSCLRGNETDAQRKSNRYRGLCENGGTCLKIAFGEDGRAHHQCVCQYGYSGSRCESNWLLVANIVNAVLIGAAVGILVAVICFFLFCGRRDNRPYLSLTDADVKQLKQPDSINIHIGDGGGAAATSGVRNKNFSAHDDAGDDVIDSDDHYDTAFLPSVEQDDDDDEGKNTSSEGRQKTSYQQRLFTPDTNQLTAVDKSALIEITSRLTKLHKAARDLPRPIGSQADDTVKNNDQSPRRDLPRLVGESDQYIYVKLPGEVDFAAALSYVRDRVQLTGSGDHVTSKTADSRMPSLNKDTATNISENTDKVQCGASHTSRWSQNATGEPVANPDLVSTMIAGTRGTGTHQQTIQKQLCPIYHHQHIESNKLSQQTAGSLVTRHTENIQNYKTAVPRQEHATRLPFCSKFLAGTWYDYPTTRCLEERTPCVSSVVPPPGQLDEIYEKDSKETCEDFMRRQFKSTAESTKFPSDAAAVNDERSNCNQHQSIRQLRQPSRKLQNDVTQSFAERCAYSKESAKQSQTEQLEVLTGSNNGLSRDSDVLPARSGENSIVNDGKTQPMMTSHCTSDPAGDQLCLKADQNKSDDVSPYLRSNQLHANYNNVGKSSEFVEVQAKYDRYQISQQTQNTEAEQRQTPVVRTETKPESQQTAVVYQQRGVNYENTPSVCAADVELSSVRTNYADDTLNAETNKYSHMPPYKTCSQRRPSLPVNSFVDSNSVSGQQQPPCGHQEDENDVTNEPLAVSANSNFTPSAGSSAFNLINDKPANNQLKGQLKGQFCYPGSSRAATGAGCHENVLDQLQGNVKRTPLMYNTLHTDAGLSSNLCILRKTGCTRNQSTMSDHLLRRPEFKMTSSFGSIQGNSVAPSLLSNALRNTNSLSVLSALLTNSGSFRQSSRAASAEKITSAQKYCALVPSFDSDGLSVSSGSSF